MPSFNIEPVCQITDDWQLAADPLQWILQRRKSAKTGGWLSVSFVSSTKEILERCMREKGVPPEAAKVVLSRLPDTFKQWRESHSGLVIGDFGIVPLSTPCQRQGSLSPP